MQGAREGELQAGALASGGEGGSQLGEAEPGASRPVGLLRRVSLLS